MKKRSKMICMLLFSMIMLSNMISCFAVSYDYYDRTLFIRQLSAGEWFWWSNRPMTSVGMVTFDNELVEGDVVLDAVNFDALKRCYLDMYSLKLKKCTLVNNEIPANTFYFGAGVGHDLKWFDIDGPTNIDRIGDWAFHYCSNLEHFLQQKG